MSVLYSSSTLLTSAFEAAAEEIDDLGSVVWEGIGEDEDDEVRWR